MRLLAFGVAAAAAAALTGGLAAAWHTTTPEMPVRTSTLAPLQATTPTWTCGPGPRSFADMDVMPGGFFRPIRGEPSQPHQFYLARAIYSESSRGWGGGGVGRSWSIDYPTADRVMTRIASRLSNLDTCDWEFPVSLADPDLRRFPFLYTVEWGRAWLTDAEVEGLRSYLMAGGFLMVDDFWGTAEWRNFAEQMTRVLPEHAIVEVPRDHQIFRSYYELDEDIIQVPSYRNGRAMGLGLPGARTWERDGYEPHLRGIFDESGRLIVAINWNTDLGDALEWAESPDYPLEYSTFASRLFLNLIIYAMAY
jgi:hypothetical protein